MLIFLSLSLLRLLLLKQFFLSLLLLRLFLLKQLLLHLLLFLKLFPFQEPSLLPTAS